MILILTDNDDPHADDVEQRLARRGARFFRLDPGQFPSNAQLSMAFSATGQLQSILTTGNERIDLQEVTSVWYRRPTPSVAHDEITDAVARDYVTEECNKFVQDLFTSLDCFWLPAPQRVIRKAEYKASQLKLAGLIGFELPPTLFTNNPDDFLAFYQEHNGNIISKLLSSALYKFTGKTFNRYTQVVSKRDIAHASGIRLCPMIFQAYVPKRVELRITVVGQQVFAVEIHSQHSNHTRHDWRRYDRYQTPYFPHELPRDLQRRCIELVERMGLCYGAIDMVLTPDDRYVFLEINPNGQYLWIEKMTGLPISEAVSDLLISGANMRNDFCLEARQ
jgi:glutathione synthase/RimK-type ligase-like ATP-grasp enzyme